VSGEIVSRLLDQGTFYVRANVSGLAPGEDLVELPNGGKSLNWILGHIVYWRNEMIALVGGTRVWSHGIGRQYRGSPGERRPVEFDGTTAESFPRLVEGFEEAGRRLEGMLTNEAVDANVAAGLVALLGHECYHAGQLGVLRRIARGEGSI